MCGPVSAKKRAWSKVAGFQLATVADAVEQMERAVRLRSECRARHREQRRDADPARDQDCGEAGVIIEHEHPGRCAHLKDCARCDAIVEMTGDESRWQIGAIARRPDPLYRNAKGLRVVLVGQGTAARDRSNLAPDIRQPQLEGQKLACAIWRKWLLIDGLEIERCLAGRVIFVDARSNAKGA